MGCTGSQNRKWLPDKQHQQWQYWINVHLRITIPLLSSSRLSGKGIIRSERTCLFLTSSSTSFKPRWCTWFNCKDFSPTGRDSWGGYYKQKTNAHAQYNYISMQHTSLDYQYLIRIEDIQAQEIHDEIKVAERLKLFVWYI